MKPWLCESSIHPALHAIVHSLPHTVNHISKAFNSHKSASVINTQNQDKKKRRK
jgi:hypothetical protein